MNTFTKQCYNNNYNIIRRCAVIVLCVVDFVCKKCNIILLLQTVSHVRESQTYIRTYTESYTELEGESHTDSE